MNQLGAVLQHQLVQDISLDNLALTGNLILSGMEQLARVSCDRNNLTSVDVSNCEMLSGLSVRSTGISNLELSNSVSLKVLDCDDNNLNLTNLIDEITIIKNRENSWVSYENQKLSYRCSVTTPDLTFDETTSTFILNTVHFSSEGDIPTSVFVEVNTFDTGGVKLTTVSGTLPINSVTGTGTFSLAAAPVILNATNEYAEIVIYTDSGRIQVVTRLVVNPVVLGF